MPFQHFETSSSWNLAEELLAASGCCRSGSQFSSDVDAERLPMLQYMFLSPLTCWQHLSGLSGLQERVHEAKMGSVGEIGKKWDARGIGYGFDQNTSHACVKFSDILKKKKFRNWYILIKSFPFLNDCRNCEAWSVQNKSLSSKAQNFWVLYCREGRIWEHCCL